MALSLQDAAAKGPAPTRTNRLMEMANQVALYIMAALAVVVVLTICVAAARADGNHSCTSCGSPRGFTGDVRSGTYTGNPGGFYSGQRATNTPHVLGQIAANIRNSIANWATRIGDFIENNFRYHYETKPDQMGILASPG